jgi:hypothetical protein
MDKETILYELYKSGKIKTGKEDFVKQSIPQKVFSSIWALEIEVNNGGFKQYFSNPSAETAGFIVQALEIVGALEAADLCKRAIACAFPLGMPADPKKIGRMAESFPEQVEEQLFALDVEFGDCWREFDDFLFAYASAHPEEFGPLPMADLTH